MSDPIRKALAELVRMYDAPWAEDWGDAMDVAIAVARAALAEQPSVRDPLTEQQIDSAIEKHVAGFDISDEDYRRMYFFARAIEREVLRAHGIGLKGEA